MSGAHHPAPHPANQPVKKPAAFRKSEFVIRDKQADTFSQIDSFKVTAKKQTEDASSVHNQGGYYASSGYQAGYMPGYPAAAGLPQQQTFPSHSSYQQHQFFQQNQGFQQHHQGFQQHHQGFQQHHQGLHQQQGFQHQQQGFQQQQFPNQTYQQSGFNLQTSNILQSGGLPNQPNHPSMINSSFPHVKNAGPANHNMLPSFSHTPQSGNVIGDVGWSGFQTHPQPANTASLGITASSSYGNMTPNDISDMSQANSSTVVTNHQSDSSTVVTNQSDDFGDFADFDEPVSSTGQTNDDFQGFSSFSESKLEGNLSQQVSFQPHVGVQAPAQHVGVQAPAQHVGVQAPAQHVGVQAPAQHVGVEFQDFSAFSSLTQQTPVKSITQHSDDFGDFGAFNESSVTMTGTDTNLLNSSSSINHNLQIASSNGDEFGDFGSFSEPSQPSVVTNKPAAAIPQLDGKRINIVVRKNLAASSAGTSNNAVTKQGSATAPLSAVTDIRVGTQASRSRSNTGPGLPDLAHTLAQATSELSAPRPTRPEEQKDFSILQEVVASNTRYSPIVKPPEPAFVLPDTASKLDEIFPRCAPPKRSAQSADEDFADFSSLPAADSQTTEGDVGGGFANFSLATQRIDPPTLTRAGEERRDDEDEFGDFPSFDVDTKAIDKPSPSQSSQSKSDSKSSIVKSEAVDWSVFSARDVLREEEDDGNLGDFSVFGVVSQSVRNICWASTAHSGADPAAHLTSDLPSHPAADLAASADGGEDDEWADFKEATPQQDMFSADLEPTLTADTEADWAAFSDVTSATAFSDVTSATAFSDVTSATALSDVTPATALSDVTPATAFSDVTPATAFSDVTPATAFSDVTPATPFSDVTPATAFSDVTPATAFSDVTPATALSDVTPATAFSDVTPATAFSDVTPATAFSDVTPATAFNDVTPATAFNDVTPAHTDNIPSSSNIATLTDYSKLDLNTPSLVSDERVKLDNSNIKSTDAAAISRVSSTMSFEQHQVADLHLADLTNDNDSDWSGFAVPSASEIHADNVSSDWSFKDNTSHSGVTADYTSHSGVTADYTSHSGVTADYTSHSGITIPDEMADSSKTLDLTLGSQSVSQSFDTKPSVNEAEDDWAAFGAINRTKVTHSVDTPVVDSRETGWGSFDDAGPLHSPPPFSPGTPGSEDFVFSTAQSNKAEANWAAFSDVTSSQSEMNNTAAMSNTPRIPDTARISDTTPSTIEDGFADFSEPVTFDKSHTDSKLPNIPHVDDKVDHFTDHSGAPADKPSDKYAVFGSSENSEWEEPAEWAEPADSPPITSDSSMTVRPDSLRTTLTRSSLDNEHQFSPPPMSDGGGDEDEGWGDFGSQPIGTDHADDNEWGAFGPEDTPADSTDHVGTSSSHTDVSNTDTVRDFNTVPHSLSDDIDNKVIRRSESPSHEFSPPPFSEGDFSPTKTPTSRPQSDWFSYEASAGSDRESPVAENFPPDFSTKDMMPESSSLHKDCTELVVELELPSSSAADTEISQNVTTTSRTFADFDEQSDTLTNTHHHIQYNNLPPTLHDNTTGPPLPDNTTGDFPQFSATSDSVGGLSGGDLSVGGLSVGGLSVGGLSGEGGEDYEDFADFSQTEGDELSVIDTLEPVGDEDRPEPHSHQLTKHQPDVILPDQLSASHSDVIDMGAPGDEVMADDWGLRGDTDGNPPLDIPEADKEDDDDNWGFKSPSGADEDEWSFGVPAETRSPASPTAPGGNTSLPHSPTAPVVDDDDDDDDEFGAFSDDDDGFADFGDAADDGVSAISVQPAVSSVSTSQAQMSGDKVSIVLQSIFTQTTDSPAVPPADVSAPGSYLTDSVTSSALWDTLTDLNQSVSLQLQWRESNSHSYLISSLHLQEDNSASSSHGGVIGLEPIPAHKTTQRSSVLTPTLTSHSFSSDNHNPSSILPPSTPSIYTRANGSLTDKSSKPSSPRNMSVSPIVDVDMFSTPGANHSQTSHNTINVSKPPSADLDDLFS